MSAVAKFMAIRIIQGYQTYDYVIERRPDLQADIDLYLIEQGRQDLITVVPEVTPHEEGSNN